MIQPISESHQHIDVDDDGSEDVFDYPAELVSALPKLREDHGKLWTQLVGPDPGIVVFRKANSIEFRNVAAAQQGDSQVDYINQLTKLGHQAVVWPPAAQFVAMAEEYPGIPVMVGRASYARALGVRESRGKGQPSSPRKG